MNSTPNNGSGTATPKQPLNRLTVTQMAKTLERVQQLTASVIQTPENQAQIETDLAFLTKNFLDNAGQFIAYWFIISGEYEPILNAFAMINRRLAQNEQTTDETPSTSRT